MDSIQKKVRDGAVNEVCSVVVFIGKKNISACSFIQHVITSEDQIISIFNTEHFH